MEKTPDDKVIALPTRTTRKLPDRGETQSPAQDQRSIEQRIDDFILTHGEDREELPQLPLPPAPPITPPPVVIETRIVEAKSGPDAPPSRHRNAIECPQCDGWTWRATQACLHCGYDLFAHTAMIEKER